MPIARYAAWVGTSLLALLFVANWFLPEYSAAPVPEASNRPIIRVASVQQPPERIVDVRVWHFSDLTRCPT